MSEEHPLDGLRGRLSAVIAVPVAPFGPDGAVDWDAHAALIERCVEGGIQVLTANGNTGEYYALSQAEAERVLEATRFAWICGLAELYAPAYWAMGATGFTSGLVNVVPALPGAMLHALRENDLAAAMRHWESVRVFEELRAGDASADNVSVVKEALSQLGLASRAVRPPSSELPPRLRVKVAALIARWREGGWL